MNKQNMIPFSEKQQRQTRKVAEQTRKVAEQTRKVAEQTFSNDIVYQRQYISTPVKRQYCRQQGTQSPIFPCPKSNQTVKSSSSNFFASQSSQYLTNRINKNEDTIFSNKNNQTSTNINNSSAMQSGFIAQKQFKQSKQQQARRTLINMIDLSLISIEESVQIRMLALSDIQNNMSFPSLKNVPQQDNILADISTGVNGQEFSINKINFQQSFTLPIKVILTRNRHIEINLMTKVDDVQTKPLLKIGLVRIPTDIILDGVIGQDPQQQEFQVMQKLDQFEELRSSQAIKLKIQIKYPPLNKMQPVKRNQTEQIKRQKSTANIQQLIDQNFIEDLSITPHKYLNPFEPIPDIISSSSNLFKDPIILVDPDDIENKCMTQQLTQQLIDFEKQIQAPQLFLQNLQQEFNSIMRIYDENHSNLQSFKSKFEGKYSSIHFDFQQLQQDLMKIRGQVLNLNDRNKISMDELQKVRQDLKIISQQIDTYDDKYQVDVSQAQNKVQSLQQDLMKIELEKLEKQLEVTQQKSRAFIQSSEILQIQREKKIKFEYEDKIEKLIQSKQYDYGDKQLLQRQNEAMNMAIKKKDEQLQILLNQQREKSAQLFKRIQDQQLELDNKNKQIESEMEQKKNLAQSQQEKVMQIKSQFAAEIDRRQKKLEQELRQKYCSQQISSKQKDEFLQEIKNLRDENQQKSQEIERLKKQQQLRRKQTSQTTPSGKDKAFQKQLQEKVFKLQQQRDCLTNEINQIKSGSRTPQTPQPELLQNQSTPLSLAIASPTSPNNRHFIFDNKSSPTRSRNYESVPVFGGTNLKESPNARIERKIRQTIQQKNYEIQFSKAQQKDMYNFGNKKIKSMISHDGTILVRVGGGFVTIQEFLKKYNSKVREAEDPEMSLMDFFPPDQFHNTPLSRFTESQQPSVSQTFGKQETAQMNPLQLSAIKKLDDQFIRSSIRKNKSVSELNPQPKVVNMSTSSARNNLLIPSRPNSTKNSNSHFKQLSQNSGFVVNRHKKSKERTLSKSSMQKNTSSPSVVRPKQSKIPSIGRKKSQEKNGQP